MNVVRHVRIFKNGRSRAVRIPKEFDIFGDEVVMRSEDGRVILERGEDRGARLRALLQEWRRRGPLSDDEALPQIDDAPPEPFDL